MLDSIKGLFADGPLGDKNTRQMIGLQMLANSGRPLAHRATCSRACLKPSWLASS
jgi:hypothetical protein